MSQSSEPTHSPAIHPLEQQRRANREAAKALGVEPYGSRTPGLVSLREAAGRYDAGADAEYKERGPGSKTPQPGVADRRPVVKVAGRVMLSRDNGKLIWLNLRDDTGDLQVAVSQRDCAAPGFDVAKLTDLGDVVVAEGPLVKTRTGELTVWASGLRPASKCLAPPPEKHAGLSDPELRYRQRYVDMWSTPETARAFELRSRIVARVRKFLEGRGFIEVETPMLQTLAGGAAARPFVTHMNALDLDLYLRIAPELYLKRLLVGGMPRVFEINRNFRNEGLDKQHNPEFTMLEAYEAFGDMTTVMELTESLVRDAARLVAEQTGGPGAPPLQPFGDVKIDYGAPFDRVTYAALFERALGFPMSDSARARDEARTRRLLSEEELRKVHDIFVVNELFEQAAEKSLDPSRPTFITEYPAALSPLTRPKPGDPAVAERADLFIAHMEVAPHYTELNDPDVQEAKFREQLAGLDDEESTFRNFDQDFINALKVGMPPAGGMGLGIDRLVMLLTDQRSIRDVLLFPLMKPVG
jgi:lysyl-tRNA synthetase class 2